MHEGVLERSPANPERAFRQRPASVVKHDRNIVATFSRCRREGTFAPRFVILLLLLLLLLLTLSGR